MDSRRTRPLFVSVSILLAAACAVSVLASACSGTASSPGESFPDAVRDFHGHLIWGRYSDAAAYLPLEERDRFISQYQALQDDVRFTEYDVGSLEVNLESEVAEADVLITMHWFREHAYVMESLEVVEKWQYDDDLELWFLVERTEPEPEPEFQDVDPRELFAPSLSMQ